MIIYGLVLVIWYQELEWWVFIWDCTVLSFWTIIIHFKRHELKLLNEIIFHIWRSAPIWFLNFSRTLALINWLHLGHQMFLRNFSVAKNSLVVNFFLSLTLLDFFTDWLINVIDWLMDRILKFFDFLTLRNQETI
jgi:hypothetical protein